MGRSLLDRPIGRPACGANNEARRKKKELGAKSETAKGRCGETAMMAHARSGSKPARISHRAITSSARRVLRSTDQGAITVASPTRPLAVSPFRFWLLFPDKWSWLRRRLGVVGSSSLPKNKKGRLRGPFFANRKCTETLHRRLGQTTKPFRTRHSRFFRTIINRG
jgi:hypothetical protein